MSTHVPGFQSFFRIFASFCIGQISHQQHKGKKALFVLTNVGAKDSHAKVSPEIFILVMSYEACVKKCC